MVAATSLGALSIVTAVARRIAGPYGSRAVGADVMGALAARPDGRAVEELRDEVAQLRAELAELRSQTGDLDELHNRLDFAERLLAQSKDRGPA